jgi:UDP-N-acetylmuramoyl-tripeptide--D-alanyl-D-alanine ligase
VINPSQNRELSSAKSKMEQSKATRIAVLGSYGKTTMKELLVTVLSEGKKIKATPGNKNVVISHARWVNTKIDGDEDVLVFEYGEAGPGDISKFASLSSPEIAVITGIAPAHMDGYPNLESITRDFAAIADTVKDENIFVKKAELLESIKGNVYGVTGIGDWRVSDIKIDFAGTNFTLRNSVDSLQLHSGLLGVHQVGPISAAAVIAKKLGLTNKQIIDGMAKTQPYEHRMQPRQLHGAWILDDTYNGNIEGMKAGLELLSSLPGKRKVYVTPGLVDQGIETENIHKQLGRLIAHANPDKVVLMQNSVTSFIQVGLSIEKFTGEVTIENDPLEYYTNLEHFLAGGDVVMLQNDWPDSYI